MRKFQSKFNEIASSQARPPKSTIFPDHPHPTMLVEGGQEPGDGPGWRTGDTKRDNNKKGNTKCKTKQRELYQVGSEIKSLSFENLLPFDLHSIEQSFTLSLPDKFLLGPYDEGRSPAHPRFEWTQHKLKHALFISQITTLIIKEVHL